MAPLTSETEGVFLGLPARTYHTGPGVSSTMLRNLDRSGKHMLAAFDDKRDTAALVYGRIVHQLVLEPDAPQWWVVPPEDLDLRKKEGKEWKAANEHKKVIKWDQWTDILGSVEALKAHAGFNSELIRGQKEVSVYRKYTSALGTVLRRGRMDLVCASPFLVDIKTTEDARPGPFSRQIHNHGYHIQAAYYLDLWNEAVPDQAKQVFSLVAVEKEPPYGVAVYRLPERAIELGREEYKKLLHKYMDCRDRNYWPGYPPEMREIDLPAYAYPKDELSLYE